MKVFKNICVLFAMLMLLPFALCIVVCTLPFLIYQAIIDSIDFDLKDDDIWPINISLEIIINFLFSIMRD